jgi:hypothetical protein
MPRKRSRRKVLRKSPEKINKRVLIPTNFAFSKKAKVEKSCMQCHKCGGVHTTNNAGECLKYEKDRILKNGFSKKVTIGQKRRGNGKKDHSNSFAQFMECFLKLEKAVKKKQKSSQKKKCCQEYSNSSDSDSE